MTEHCMRCGRKFEPKTPVPVYEPICARKLAGQVGLDSMALVSGKVLRKRKTKAPQKERACRVCGCTNLTPCPGGCAWVEPDLCSACAEIKARSITLPDGTIEIYDAAGERTAVIV